MYQKLMTKELENKMPGLYSQENERDPIVWAHFFHPLSSMDLYFTEYSPAEKVFFGWNSMDRELGYTSLTELESVKVHGLGVERDMHFSPKPLSWVKSGKEHASYAMPKNASGKSKKKSSPSGLGGTR